MIIVLLRCGLVAYDCTVSHTDVSLDDGMYGVVSW